MRSTVRRTLTSIAALLLATPVFAQFTPGPNPITGTVGAQTLSTGTGTIDSGGVINISSGGGVALALTGTSNLINNGTIQTLGTGRAVDSNSGTANLTLINNGLISSVSSDAFRVNTDSTVSLTNSGTIRVTAGGQAIDWAAITSKSNTLNNTATGVITAVGEDAVRMGTNGVVLNAGTISATPIGGASPSGSDGIDLRTFTGISITNTGSISGRHGVATDGSNTGPSTVTVNNNTGGTITALNGSGINIDGVSINVTANVINQVGATIKGGVLLAATDGDGDGIDVDGVLTLDNAGDVFGLGAKGGGNNAEGIAAGGGSIINRATGKIVGSSLALDAPNGDTGKAGNGILIDDGNGGNAVAATNVTNSGLIQGKTGFGIKMIGTFANTLTNNAGGTIRGAGMSAAIQTGNGDDTVTNRGAIVSDIGDAIDLEGGTDWLKIEGGAASIIGDISGGAGSNTLTFDLGLGSSFSYAGSISNFDMMEINSGLVMLSGVNAFTGTTLITGGTLQFDGANRISASSALDLNGGTLEIVNAGGANGQTFACLALTESSTIDLNFTTSLTLNCLGTIVSGKTLTVLGYLGAASPDYAFRLLGNYSGDANFLSLLARTTINGLGATFHFDGTYTDVNVDVVSTPEVPAVVLVGLSGALFLALRGRQWLGKRPESGRFLDK